MNLEIPMVSVIGLGHIGLPVFDELIKRHVIDRVPSAPAIGSDIVGVDISPDARDRAMQIINSKYDLGESCRVRVTGTLENSSVYIIAIYSPEGIMEMLTKIIPEINDGAALVIIESTFEPEYLCDEKYGHDFSNNDLTHLYWHYWLGGQIYQKYYAMDHWQLFVKDLEGFTVTMVFNDKTTVEEMKMMIYDCTDVCTESQRLIFAGKQLEDGLQLVGDYNIRHNSTIHLVLRLVGC